MESYKSASVSQNGTRILAEELDVTKKYVYTQKFYLINPFRLDDSFHYKLSPFPLIDGSFTDIETKSAGPINITTLYSFNVTQGLIDQASGFSKFNTSIIVTDYNELKNHSSNANDNEAEQILICIQRLSATNWNGTECVT
jgi:hypothetical protein